MREHKGHDDSATFDACTIITRITSSNESEPSTELPLLKKKMAHFFTKNTIL